VCDVHLWYNRCCTVTSDVLPIKVFNISSLYFEYLEETLCIESVYRKIKHAQFLLRY